MATITDYSTLQFAIGDFLNRTDLADVIPTFIQLCESSLKRVVKTKHLNRSELTLPSGGGVITLPANTTNVLSLYVTDPSDKGGPIVATSPEKVFAHRAVHQTAARPQFGAMVEYEFLVSPLADQEYKVEVVVEGPFVPLSDTFPTNWILTDYPDAYLYGSLVASAPYLQNDPRLATWESMYRRGLTEMEQARAATMWPNTPVAPPPRVLGV